MSNFFKQVIASPYGFRGEDKSNFGIFIGLLIEKYE